MSNGWPRLCLNAPMFLRFRNWYCAGWGSVTNARAVLERHWDTFITADDFNYLANIGINTVRIPIAWFTLGPPVLGWHPFEPYIEVLQERVATTSASHQSSSWCWDRRLGWYARSSWKSERSAAFRNLRWPDEFFQLLWLSMEDNWSAQVSCATTGVYYQCDWCAAVKRANWASIIGEFLWVINWLLIPWVNFE